MEMKPSLMFGSVWHRRFFPKPNSFDYRIFYLCLPLSRLRDAPLPLNRFGLLSFHEKDHGPKDGGNLEEWARGVLRDRGASAADGEITLMTLPRVLGYVFNPVSFWFCRDRRGKLRAVICEVNNTFGETHAYLCAREDGGEIGDGENLWGEKLFHVSPFLRREGHYSFRFRTDGDSCSIRIDYHDPSGERRLATALSGSLEPMGAPSLRKAFWGYPLLTARVVWLIHWQALKLLLKGIRYIPLPKKFAISVSKAGNRADSESSRPASP